MAQRQRERERERESVSQQIMLAAGHKKACKFTRTNVVKQK